AQTLASLVEVGTSGVDMEDIRKPQPHWITRRAAGYWSMHCADGTTASSTPPLPAHPDDWIGKAKPQPAFASLQGKRHMLPALWFTVNPGADDASSRRKLSGNLGTCSVIFVRSGDAMNDILTVIDDILLLIPLLAVLAVLLLTPVLVRRGLRPLAALGNAMHG